MEKLIVVLSILFNVGCATHIPEPLVTPPIMITPYNTAVRIWEACGDGEYYKNTVELLEDGTLQIDSICVKWEG